MSITLFLTGIEITGFPRLLQALQAAEWDAGAETLDDMLGLDDEDDVEGYGEQENEEMREPILAESAGSELNGKTAKPQKESDEDEDVEEEDVEELQRMMTRLQAARGLFCCVSLD